MVQFSSCLPSTNETNELNDNFNNKYYVSVGNIFGAPKQIRYTRHFFPSSMRLLPFTRLFVEILLHHWIRMNYFLSSVFFSSFKAWFSSSLCSLPLFSHSFIQLIVMIKWNQCLLPKRKMYIMNERREKKDI